MKGNGTICERVAYNGINYSFSHAAALASRAAFEHYGIIIYDASVSDIKDNWTKFAVIKRRKQKNGG